MNILKQAGWYTYAALATILSMGIYPRFHLITVRKRTMGGVRAGRAGWIHVHLDPEFHYLVISGLFTKQHLPLDRIAYVEKQPMAVKIESTGGKTVNVFCTQPKVLERFVTTYVLKYFAGQRRATGQA